MNFNIIRTLFGIILITLSLFSCSENKDINTILELCLVGSLYGTPDISFNNDYPQNLREKEYIFDDHLAGNSIKCTMGIPGNWHLAAYIVQNDTVYAKASTTIIVKYPEVSSIPQKLSSEIDDLWEETLDAADKNGREEKGCWIYAYLYNQSVDFFFGKIETGNNVPYENGSNGSIVPSQPTEKYPNDYDNLESGEYAAAYIHTHTPLAYADKSSYLYRDTGPSDEDRSWSDSNRMPLFVIDYSGSSISNRDPINLPKTVYQIGPSYRDENYY